MSLCSNTYRRGSIYWWRRRFADPRDGRSRTMAFSLGVRDPASARIAAARVTAASVEIANELERGMITFTDAEARLRELAAQTFVFDQHAFNGLRPRPAVRSMSPPFSGEQEQAAIAHMAREIVARLESVASYNMTYNAVGACAAMRQHLVDHERATGHVYRLVAAHGGDAHVGDSDAALMAAAGLSQELVTFVRRETAQHARAELWRSWTLGPSRDYFVEVLEQADVVPSGAAIAHIRSTYLLLFAEALFDAENRYATASSPLARALGALRGKTDHNAVSAKPDQEKVPDEVAAPSLSAKGTVSAVEPAALHDVPAIIVAEPIEPGSTRSFTGRIETLANRRELAKRRKENGGWVEKTGNQHRSVAALFAKVANSDDPRLMSQSDIGRYRDILDFLPKTWGKSPKDQFRTIDEILAAAEDLDEDEIGLKWGTINRHMTQLGNCLDCLRGHGHAIGEVMDFMRASGEPAERVCFTDEDEYRLFRSPIWTGPSVTHGAMYYVPLFGKYDVVRLGEVTGLAADDIDLENNCYHIRPNCFRGVKNKSSIRRLPISPEARRLNFYEYVREIRRLGYKGVWPELPMRGPATPLSNLFYKPWVDVLDEALPMARAERKSFHSWRKAGNTAMAGKNINDPLRYQIMGHAYKDINGKNYTAELALADKLAALSVISITTAHIEARPLRLDPSLKR